MLISVKFEASETNAVISIDKLIKHKMATNLKLSLYPDFWKV